jgi:hypothetical protein
MGISIDSPVRLSVIVMLSPTAALPEVLVSPGRLQVAWPAYTFECTGVIVAVRSRNPTNNDESSGVRAVTSD